MQSIMQGDPRETIRRILSDALGVTGGVVAGQQLAFAHPPPAPWSQKEESRHSNSESLMHAGARGSQSRCVTIHQGKANWLLR